MTERQAGTREPEPSQTARLSGGLAMRRMKMAPRRQAKRPPFENRFGNGEQGWRWYVELEYLGPEYVRIRIAQQEALAEIGGLEPFDVHLGFAHDWLVYRDRRDRRLERRWRAVTLLFAALAAAGAIVAAIPVVAAWR